MRERGTDKGKGKATITQNRLINGGLLSCGEQKTFLTNMLEPSSYWGLVKIYTTDAKWVEVCIVMPHYLETRQQQSQDIEFTKQIPWLWIEPNLSQRQTWDVKRCNQNEVLHNLAFSIKRDYLLEVEQYTILPINCHIYGTIYVLYETTGYWENQRWQLVNLIICFSVAVYACSYVACAGGLLLATVQ